MVRENDISFKSMSLIESRFEQMMGMPLFVPDWKEKFNENSNAQTVYALVMGSFYQRIFQPDLWPSNDFYFFCLSPSVKSVLVDLLGFEDRYISVVPRYDLFPKAPEISTTSSLSHLHLIHAGRISPQKNIEFVIFVTFYFQLLHSAHTQLTLMGNFDDQPHWNVPNLKFYDYKKKIITIIENLPWSGRKPQIITGLNGHQWIDVFPKDAIFFSASNLISEDFSVSLAQLQESKDCNAIVPYWGGFKDALGDNIGFYKEDMVASSQDSLSSISAKAKRFVENYLNQNLLFRNPHSSSISFSLPQKMNRDYLVKKIIDNKTRWGKEIEMFSSREVFDFAKLKSGERFFHDYRAIFRGESLPGA